MRRFFLACAMVLGWAVLVAARPAQSQGLKVRLGADTGSYLRFFGQERVRGESWTGYNATPSLDDAFGLSRLLVDGELAVGGVLQVVGEVKSSLASDRSLPGGQRTSDVDEIDVQQLFGRVSLPWGGARITAQAGRFDLAVGRERLVGPSDWTNTRRVFQGATLGVRRGAASLTLLATRPVAVRRHTPNLADSTRLLYGAVVGRTSGAVRTEAYWLRSEARTATLNGTSGYQRLHTLGARLLRAPSRNAFDYDAEAAWQTGTLGGANVNAWMVGSVLGRSLGGALAARVYLGLDAGSGDRAAGGAVGTFSQLFPTGHAFLGYADVHGRQNIVAPSAGASIRVYGTAVQLDAYDFSRASTHDGLYAVDGSLAHPAGSGLAAHVGDEIDLTLKRAVFGGRVALQAGASRYFAGRYLQQSLGSAKDLTFAYAQATVLF